MPLSDYGASTPPPGSTTRAAGGVQSGLRCARRDDQLNGARVGSRREAGKRRLAADERQRPRGRMKRGGEGGGVGGWG